MNNTFERAKVIINAHNYHKDTEKCDCKEQLNSVFKGSNDLQIGIQAVDDNNKTLPHFLQLTKLQDIEYEKEHIKVLIKVLKTLAEEGTYERDPFLEEEDIDSDFFCGVVQEIIRNMQLSIELEEDITLLIKSDE